MIAEKSSVEAEKQYEEKSRQWSSSMRSCST